MKKLGTALAGAVFFVGLFISGTAWAVPGYVTRSINLRAGPDITYPIVDRVRAGARVNILGCIDGWNWCEVRAYGDRGWVSGNYLQAFQRNRRVYIRQAGPVIQVPIIHFEVGSYWNEHYRNKPFYRDRHRWVRDRHEHDDRDDRDWDRHDRDNWRNEWNDNRNRRGDWRN